MPTVFDIPKHLLDKDRKNEFKGWIKRLPVENWIKRELVRIWKRTTGENLDFFDYQGMGL
jgi:hypothetical protein